MPIYLQIDIFLDGSFKITNHNSYYLIIPCSDPVSLLLYNLKVKEKLTQNECTYILERLFLVSI